MTISDFISDGLYYWSQLPIASNPIKLENQRPYVGPRLYQETDSTAVEATSWALLVYLANDGVTSFVENIVQWLISVRMTENGFISVVVSDWMQIGSGIGTERSSDVKPCPKD